MRMAIVLMHLFKNTKLLTHSFTANDRKPWSVGSSLELSRSVLEVSWSRLVYPWPWGSRVKLSKLADFGHEKFVEMFAVCCQYMHLYLISLERVYELYAVGIYVEYVNDSCTNIVYLCRYVTMPKGRGGSRAPRM